MLRRETAQAGKEPAIPLAVRAGYMQNWQGYPGRCAATIGCTTAGPDEFQNGQSGNSRSTQSAQKNGEHGVPGAKPTRDARKGGERDANTAAFARGMRQFNAREFWHAHESWEAIWLTAPEPEKTFLQGIIQISAAFYHHQKQNLAGTRSLLARGLEKVERFPAEHRGLRLEELRRAVRNWLEELEGTEACAGKRYPRLRWASRKQASRRASP